jgi:carbon storage regulator
MLILSRKIEEGLIIGGNIEIKILDVFATDDSGSRKSKVASIGIDAPRDIQILRKELLDTMRQNREAELSALALAQKGQRLTGTGLSGILKKKRRLEDPDAE